MTDTQELAEEAIAETEVAPTPDVESLRDYTRLVWVRIRSGESGVLPVVGGFLLIDLSFLSANAVKLEHGGWVPLALAIGIYLLMSTWKRGRVQLGAIQEAGALPLDLFLHGLDRNPPVRVKGTAVFMTSDVTVAPPVLVHHLKHNKVLHQRVILLSVVTKEVPAWSVMVGKV